MQARPRYSRRPRCGFRSGAIALAVATAALAASGCITREVLDPIYDRDRVEVILVEHKRGSKVIERDFEHPTRISVERLENILGALEIRGREAELAGVRYVFEPDQLEPVANALAYGLQKASPNQSIAVRLTAKVVQHAIFDRKHITSFVAYVQDDLLFLHVSRVDWKDPDVSKKTDPPLPRVDEHPMQFRVVPGGGMYAEGVYAVSVDWQNPRFARAQRLETADAKGERTILLEDTTPVEQEASGLPSDVLAHLSAAQLRELADLEEARQQGKITEGHYRREREKILDEARK